MTIQESKISSGSVYNIITIKKKSQKEHNEHKA
jgi:hypothetical protein